MDWLGVVHVSNLLGGGTLGIRAIVMAIVLDDELCLDVDMPVCGGAQQSCLVMVCSTE